MSWITRCPDCNTVYKVESEQLQQAHGWLRCGACQHVFDSAGRVVSADVIPTLTERVNVGAPQVGRVDLERLLHKESSGPVTPEPVAPAPVHAIPDEPSPVAAFEDALQSFKLQPQPPQPAAAPSEVTPEPGGAPPLRTASAVRAARQPAPVRSSSLGAWVAVLLLVLVLVLQLLITFREQVLTRWPEWGQVAARWCSTPACHARFQPPMSVWQLNDVSWVVDGAGYRLGWRLTHSAEVALPLPDLELSLSNPLGDVISVRRLDAPQTAAPAVLERGQAWEGALQVEVEPGLDVHGYQLRVVARIR